MLDMYNLTNAMGSVLDMEQEHRKHNDRPTNDRLDNMYYVLKWVFESMHDEMYPDVDRY